jgi:hypothetical protein
VESEINGKHNWSVMSTINAMVEEATDSEKTHKTMIETVLSSPMKKHVNYFRLNPPGIAEIKLNSSSMDELKFMEELTKSYIDSESIQLQFEKIKEIISPSETPYIFSTEDLMKIYFEKKPNEEVSLFEKFENFFKTQTLEKPIKKELKSMKEFHDHKSVAICDFDDDQFSFKKGDVIRILSRNEMSGFWEGFNELNNKKGKFPMNYTESGQAWLWLFKNGSFSKMKVDQETLASQFELYFKKSFK